MIKSFNPLNLGSASARRAVDRLMRMELHPFQSPQSGICFCERFGLVLPPKKRRNFQSPQSGICFCEGRRRRLRQTMMCTSFNPLNLGSASARKTPVMGRHMRSGCPFNPLNLGSASARRSPRATWTCWMHLSIPSIWDLLLRAPRPPTMRSCRWWPFNPLNLGSASARASWTGSSTVRTVPFNPLNLGSASARGDSRD